MRLFNLSVKLFLAGLLFALAVPLNSYAQIQTPPGVVVPFRKQTIYAPVAGLRDFSTWDLAVVNRSPGQMGAVVTLYSTDGEKISEANIALAGNETRHFDVSKLIGKSEGRQAPGGVAIDFSGQSLGIGAQMTISGFNGFGNVDAPVFEDLAYKSNTADAVWWEPGGAQSRLILGNSSGNSIEATAIFEDGSRRNFKLAPHATSISPVPETTKGHVNSFHVVGTGDAGTLRITGYTVSPENNFVRTIRTYDPESNGEPSVYANGLRFSGGETHLVVKNVSLQPVSVSGTLFPPGKGQASIDIPAESLAPGAAKELQLPNSEQLEQLDGAAIKVTSSGLPASVIADFTNHGSAGHVTYSIPFKSVGDLSTLTGAYPWRLDGAYRSTIFITNVGTARASVGAKIFPVGGKEYFIDSKYLEPGESVSVNIGQLREERTPDKFGVVLSADATVGQFWWSSIFGDGTEKLIGRNEVIDPRNGISASFSCNSCNCPSSTPSGGMTPSSLQVVVNQGFSSLVPFGTSENTCNGQNTGNFGIYPTSWNIQTPGYFGITTGSSPSTLTGTSDPGTSTFYTPFTGIQYAWNGGTGTCFVANQPAINPGGSATTVGPADHVVVVVDQQGASSSCPTTGVQLRQMKMRVVDVNGKTVPGPPSVAESQNPTSPTNSCGNGSPIAAPCAATASDSTYLDSMGVSKNLCNSGISRSSGCGYTVTSTWSACAPTGSQTLWVSSRSTTSNLVTVDGNSTSFAVGTICNGSGCH